MNYVELTYFHTLYKTDVTCLVCGGITFEDGFAFFASSGHRYRIKAEHVRSINAVE